VYVPFSSPPALYGMVWHGMVQFGEVRFRTGVESILHDANKGAIRPKTCCGMGKAICNQFLLRWQAEGWYPQDLHSINVNYQCTLLRILIGFSYLFG